jgi:hypothetical protein
MKTYECETRCTIMERNELHHKRIHVVFSNVEPLDDYYYRKCTRMLLRQKSREFTGP